MLLELTWWCVPLIIIPIWLITNATHEVLGHGVWLWLWKWNFKTYILPHFYDSQTNQIYYHWEKLDWLKKSQRPQTVTFYFARCDFIKTDASLIIPPLGYALIFIGPRLINTLIILLGFLLIEVLQIKDRIGTILAVWTIANLIDAAVGFSSIFSNLEKNSTDIRLFKESIGWNLLSVRILSAAWLGILTGILTIILI
jgi:hypothetical protein